MTTSIPDDLPLPKAKPLDIVTLIPENWREVPGQAYMSAYRMLGIPLADLTPRRFMELEDACVVMGWLGMPQLGLDVEIEPRADGQILVAVRGDADRQHPPGPTTLVIARISGSDEWAARTRIDGVVGLLSALAGQPVVHRHMENYRLSWPDGSIGPTSQMVVNPLWHYEVNLSLDAVNSWTAASAAASAHPDSDRIYLALRWFDEARRASGVDAYLRFWVALETLGMPNSTNISLLRDQLGRIYGISQPEVESRFGVGKLFSLRSRIVHEGLRIDIQGPLLLLIAGIFIDILLDRLGFSSALRAQAALDEVGGLRVAFRGW